MKIFTGKEYLPLEIESVKFFKNMVILKFEGIDNINDVEQYKKCNLYVDRAHAVKLQKDEYFVTDLIGVKVFKDDEEFGTLTEIIPTGANDVYVIVDYGVKINEVAGEAQQKVKTAIEEMTGLNILSVNIHVQGIKIAKEPKDEESADLKENDWLQRPAKESIVKLYNK